MDDSGPVRTTGRLRMSGRPAGATDRAIVAVAGIAAVVLVGLADEASPEWVSFAALYLLVVVVVTRSAGLLAGLLVATASSVAWGVGDGADDIGIWRTLASDALRFVALGIAALLVWQVASALHRARTSEERTRQFLAAAAHQLRTPVASVQASAEALLYSDVSPEQEQLVGRLTAETARIGRLISALLRMARLDQGEQLRLRPVAVMPIVLDELERVGQRSTLEVSAGGDRRAVAMIDVDATRDALANVLDNARRHANDRIDVTVRAGTRREVEIVVADDGPGLPAGSEERAFERFVSLDGRGGAGLGLAIARTLMRSQGGSLHYAARTFVLTAPAGRGAPGSELDEPAQAVVDRGGPSE